MLVLLPYKTPVIKISKTHKRKHSLQQSSLKEIKLKIDIIYTVQKLKGKRNKTMEIIPKTIRT